MDTLPSWATCWAKHNVTDDMVPAVFDILGVGLLDEDLEYLGSDWELYITPEQARANLMKIGAILAIVAIGGVSLWLFGEGVKLL